MNLILHINSFNSGCVGHYLKKNISFIVRAHFFKVCT